MNEKAQPEGCREASARFPGPRGQAGPPVVGLPRVPKGDVPELPSVGVSSSLRGELRELTQMEELEVLEQTQSLSIDAGIDAADVRPCVAALFYEGALKGTGRERLCFTLALELKVAGVALGRLGELLREWNERVVPPLMGSELNHIMRQMERPSYEERHRCDHIQLAGLCIGHAICPWLKIRKSGVNPALRKLSGAAAFVTSDWPAYIPPPCVSVYVALLRMRIHKRYEPGKPFGFNFAQLEFHAGVSRSSIRRHLENLKNVGLIEKLEIGTKWGSEKKLRTNVILATPIANPQTLGLRPLRLRE